MTYLRPAQVARILGVSRNSVIRWCGLGLLPGSFQIGAGWHIPPEALTQAAERFLEKQREREMAGAAPPAQTAAERRRRSK